ncbi:MAG: protein kinase [Anaerolineae bacterium]|nr:protein kinase [Anaerolineae bacterium]
MTSAALVSHLGNRYQVIDQLGAGGMGAVYRVYDRLSGTRVALKRLLDSQHTTMISPISFADSLDVRLALTREFQTLASLRHPNIISVLDYGFDADGQPYYTMSLLENATSLRLSGEDRNAHEQISLIVQVLQALEYLHRRGILHRDLKPENVLVSADGQVRVLDFGLAILRGTPAQGDDSTAGTITYMAPEVLTGGIHTEASDLYAVGVMAFELLTGKHPFFAPSLSQLINNILHNEPDLLSLDPNSPITAVITKLLSKDPRERYGSAYEAVHALCSAASIAIPAESAAIRDSFLQAASFVGRDSEMETLHHALEAAMTRQGSLWLIGGESGVGKSRLLEELRVSALVKGALVLRGYAVLEGGLPYQLWRDLLRRLVLSTDLTPTEAAILQELVPDIAQLLEQTIPDAPPADASISAERLKQLVIDLFRRQTTPIVLILEDLHWLKDGLDIMQSLAALVPELPLLILASYRDEERPDFPQFFPEAQVMTLKRLSREDIARLSEAMLGQTESEMLDLLQRETEGNTFFLVEVIRALAEEAGRLDGIMQMTLPRSMFIGGVRRIVQRRLDRIPAEMQPLLKLAAVSGRVLDLDLLRDAANGNPLMQAQTDDFETWLTTCVNAAVLEVQENEWRFAHDRLRDGLIHQFTPAERQLLHQYIATSIEKLYPNDPKQAARLAYHYSIIGDGKKEFFYTYQAGVQTFEQNNYPQTVVYMRHALRLITSDDPEANGMRIEALTTLAHALEFMNAFEEAEKHLTQAQQLADRLADPSHSWHVYLVLASLNRKQFRYDVAVGHAQRALDYVQRLDPRSAENEAHVYYQLGTAGMSSTLISKEQALHFLEQGLVYARESNTITVNSALLNALAIFYYEHYHDDQRAKATYQEAIALAQTYELRLGEAIPLMNLAGIYYELGQYQEAIACSQRAAELFAQLSVRGYQIAASAQSALYLLELGDWEAAKPIIDETETLAALLNIHDWYPAHTLYCYLKGDYPTALTLLEKGYQRTLEHEKFDNYFQYLLMILTYVQLGRIESAHDFAHAYPVAKMIEKNPNDDYLPWYDHYRLLIDWHLDPTLDERVKWHEILMQTVERLSRKNILGLQMLKAQALFALTLYGEASFEEVLTLTRELVTTVNFRTERCF